MIAVNVVGQVCSKLQDYSVWKLEIKVNYELDTKIFDRLSNQSMTFHTNRFGGSLVSQTSKFVNAYAALLEQLVYAIVPIASAAVFTICLLAPLVPPLRGDPFGLARHLPGGGPHLSSACCP